MVCLRGDTVVVVRNFNATRLLRHVEATAILLFMYLYSLAFIDHPCTLGAAVCHQAPPCPIYTQPRVRRVWARHTNGLIQTHDIPLERWVHYPLGHLAHCAGVILQWGGTIKGHQFPLSNPDTITWLRLLRLTLMLSTMGKIFSRQHIEIFFLFFAENRFWHFIQIASNGDNLYEMSNSVFWVKIGKT